MKPMYRYMAAWIRHMQTVMTMMLASPVAALKAKNLMITPATATANQPTTMADFLPSLRARIGAPMEARNAQTERAVRAAV